MNKKVVVLGGGTGLSTLLRGLKQFPLDLTAIVSVSDDGRSTGRLREEFKTPAVGDIRQVIVALSETEPLVQELINYRFKTTSDLNGHTIGNLLLTAMTNITGNLSNAIESLEKVFNLKGKVLPLTEDNVDLIAIMEDGTIVEGEHNITESYKKIKRIYYKQKPKVTPEAILAIKDADLIILSMGSLYTSVIPNLICKELINALDSTQAKIMYVCNLMTQPGETDDFDVYEHIEILNNYLGKKKVDIVIANNGEIKRELINKYAVLEQKDPVILKKEKLKNVEIIEDNFVLVEKDVIRHNSVKVAFHVFNYLLLR